MNFNAHYIIEILIFVFIPLKISNLNENIYESLNLNTKEDQFFCSSTSASPSASSTSSSTVSNNNDLTKILQKSSNMFHTFTSSRINNRKHIFILKQLMFSLFCCLSCFNNYEVYFLLIVSHMFSFCFIIFTDNKYDVEGTAKCLNERNHYSKSTFFFQWEKKNHSDIFF